MVTNDKNVNNSVIRGRVFSYMRWSSKPQTWGDSERRQLQAAQEWCAQHGTKLADEKFVDSGVSARDGRNRERSLGRLVNTLRAGDYLLVEDQDRLSREDWLTAARFLDEVTAKGVMVAVLSNNQIITRETFLHDPGVFLPAVLKMYAANDENLKRTQRIRQAMAARREQIKAGKPVAGPLPCWLDWKRDEQGRPVEPRQAVVVEEKAKSVRRIFELSRKGLGVHSILRELMLQKVACPSRGPKSCWNSRLIYRLLTDKAVLGYYEIEKPEELSVPGVFPAIISKADFQDSGDQMRDRCNHTAPFKYQNNSLFTALCKCSICGSSLIKCRTGHNGKYYDYLCCSSGLRNWKKEARCKVRGTGINYEKFEKSFAFLLTRTARVRELLAEDGGGLSRLDALKDQLCSVQKRAEKYLKLIETEDDPPRSILEALKSLEAQEAEFQGQVDSESARMANKAPAIKPYAELTALDMQNKEHRSKIRKLLREIVKSITVELGQDRYVVAFSSGKSVSATFGPAGTWMID